jgi:hypothetical protein
MANLIASAIFTRNTGQPATGLALGDIDFYLTSQNLQSGADAVVWDGTQNPTEEIDNIGAYSRIYASADFSLFAYYLRATYTGAIVLDVDDVTGATQAWQVVSFPAGSIEYTYTVTNSVSGLPIPDVDVWFSTDLAGDNVVWRGRTDDFGVARDVANNLPWLDAGTWFVWAVKTGFTFPLPDTEIIS